MLTHRSFPDSFERIMDHTLGIGSVLLSKLLEGCSGYPARNPAKPWDELDPIRSRDLGIAQPFQSLLGPFDKLIMHAGDGHAIGDLHNNSRESPLESF